jgi:oxepin-CoA hydrolase/3-oxo-5,6-dehydrosuberyl-CoA semialdehyde dehydrogenase
MSFALKNYACGQWVAGEENQLFHAISGEVIATAGSEKINLGEMMQYARSVGGPALRKMTFHERGRALRSLAQHLLANKDKYYSLSAATGATKVDSWVDIEGGIGNLFSYASLRRQFPDKPYAYDGDFVSLSKGGTFGGHHLLVPKEGVAIHINAFNFPVWGMLEKIAVNLLAGVPAIVKPATITSYLTELVFHDIIQSGIFPEGSLQLVCGSARGILDHVTSQDIVTFTGSAETGKMLKKHSRIIDEAVPFNMEADSLNCCVLGPDVTPDLPEFDIFVKEVLREMTTKAGQKCTAVRRIMVPAERLEEVKDALISKLSKTVVGDPSVEGVRMGALAGKEQVKEVLEKVEALSSEQSLVFGSLDHFEVVGANRTAGAFLPPMLFVNDAPKSKILCHELEAFGPVATLMPYSDVAEAAELAKMGKGSLVCSMVTANDDVALDFTLAVGAYHGRVLILNASCAKESTGHGSPMPMLVHGGPGRAGGGEEMGGLRGVKHYLHRLAIQGSPTTLSKLTGVYQQGGHQFEGNKHLFRKHFEEMEIGETVFTHKRTITEADIVSFANVSWDHFYAHTDETALEGTLFTQRVAHGYFILSAAAGLFVDPAKGPVLLNYGLDEFRFTKPVYAGTTIWVKLTVKEKIDQETKGENDVPKGIVKFRVEVLDQNNETLAVGTILTMVKKR